MGNAVTVTEVADRLYAAHIDTEGVASDVSAADPIPWASGWRTSRVSGSTPKWSRFPSREKPLSTRFAPSGWRPILLLFVVGKGLERLVARRIEEAAWVTGVFGLSLNQPQLLARTKTICKCPYDSRNLYAKIQSS